MVKAQPQDDSRATSAPKITPEESWLSFDEEATVLHNKVRAFAGWPGTRAKLAIDGVDGQQDIVDLKIVTTRVCPEGTAPQATGVDEITFSKDALVIPCGNSTALEILELQLPGKKVVNAAAFLNGWRGKRLRKV